MLRAPPGSLHPRGRGSRAMGRDSELLGARQRRAAKGSRQVHNLSQALGCSRSVVTQGDEMKVQSLDFLLGDCGSGRQGRQGCKRSVATSRNHKAPSASQRNRLPWQPGALTPGPGLGRGHILGLEGKLACLVSHGTGVAARLAMCERAPGSVGQRRRRCGRVKELTCQSPV